MGQVELYLIEIISTSCQPNKRLSRNLICDSDVSWFVISDYSKWIGSHNSQAYKQRIHWYFQDECVLTSYILIKGCKAADSGRAQGEFYIFLHPTSWQPSVSWYHLSSRLHAEQWAATSCRSLWGGEAVYAPKRTSTGQIPVEYSWKNAKRNA